MRLPGARDFAEVSLSLRDTLNASVDAFGRAHPTFKKFLGQVSAEDAAARSADYWQRFERAFAGDWEALAERLRVNGVVYARVGASLLNWQELAHHNAGIIFPALIARFGRDPERLAKALIASQAFNDRAMCVFNDSFVVASHATLHQSDLMFQLLSLGMVIVDADNWMREANDAFLSMYQLTPSSLQGRPFASLFVPGQYERDFAAQDPQAVVTGRVSFETRHLRGSGTEFPVRLDGVRLSPVGQPELWGICVHDLTQRTQVEALSLRGAELEAENDRVREATRVKSEFLANMSHELRTPLNSILGFSELLLGGEVGPLAEQQLDFVHDIHTSGKHLLRLINDVLDLSKVEAGKLEFFAEDVDVEALANEVVQLCRRATDRSYAIRVRVDPAVRRAHLDPIRLKQVLYNYLSNALKFTAQPGAGSSAPVELVFAPEGEGRFRLSVVDHGEGIAPENVHRLFRTFEQLDASRAKSHSGTGLGLAITKRLVEAQGGEVGATSVLGEGSTFYAVLPLSRPSSVRPVKAWGKRL